MKKETQNEKPGIQEVSTDIYVYDNQGAFAFIDSDKLSRWEQYDGSALLGTHFLDSVVDEHKAWVDEAFFQATKRNSVSSFFARGGDRGSIHWDDIQHVISHPSQDGGMIVQSTMYRADRVRAMVSNGLWFGEIPEFDAAWS